MTEETLKRYIRLKNKIYDLEDYLEAKSSSVTSQLKKDKVAQNEIRKPVENEVLNKIAKGEELQNLKIEKENLELEIIEFIKTVEKPLHKKIMTLRYLAGYNTIEIAGILKLKKKTVINNMSEIRKIYLKKIRATITVALF